VQVQQRLGQFIGNSLAKGALDTAWWNLQAKQTGKPLPSLLGGRIKEIPISLEMPPSDSIDKLLAAMQAARDRGIARFHLQLRPGWDIEVLRAVRQCFPAQTMSVGCGGQLTLDKRDFFFRLEDFHLAYIEQPLDADDIVGHAMVQESLRTPIALRHSVNSADRVRQAIDLGAARQLVIEPGRAGGPTQSMEILAIAREAKLPCAIATRPQTIVAAALDQALCSIEPVTAWQIPWASPPDQQLLAWPNLLESAGQIVAKAIGEAPIAVDLSALSPHVRSHARLG
jgi:O-succinylbenzoate synthase